MARKARSVAPPSAPMPPVEPFGRRRSPTLTYVFGGIYLLMLAGGFAIGMAAGSAKPSAKKTVAVAENKKTTTKGKAESPPEEVALLTKPKEPAHKEEPKAAVAKEPEPAPMPEPKPEPKMEKPEPKPEAKMEKPEPKPVAKTEPKPPAKTEPKKGPTTLVTFTKQIAPILKDKCVNCHGGASTKGGLDLRGAKETIKGGDSGSGVVPGDPDNSPVWQQIADGTMPPKGKPKLTDDEKKLIKDWIAGGAK